MGVWGDGIFDGDGACDFLGSVIDELANVVDEGLRLGKTKKNTPYFQSAKLVKGHCVLTLHDPVIPAIAILNAVVAKIPSARFCLEKKQVRIWKREYFQWYEEQYVPVNGEDEPYRKSIMNVFNSLLRKLEVEEL